jgi:tripartite-type tricarboxylate transporter receptor subunit TctC
LSIAFAKTEDDRRVMELVYSQSLFGRPFVLPPGVPADRTAAVRKAFMDALKDPALLAEAQRMRLEIDPISGEDLQQLITQIYSLPANIVQRAKQALIYRPPAH